MRQRLGSRLPPSLLLAFATFLVLGLTSGLLGVAWPGIRLSFQQPLGALSLVILADTSGYAVSSTLSGPVAARTGRGWLLFGGAASAVAGLLLVALAPLWPVLLGGYVLVGIAGGIYDGSMNGHVSLVGGVRSMNLLHGIWGLGAAIGPQVAYAMSHSTIGWPGAYLLVGVLELGLAVTFLLTRGAWSVPEAPAHEAAHTPGRRPLLLGLTLVQFFLYTGIEVAGGQWSYSLLVTRGTPGALAALAVTAYWAMLSAGRLIVGLLPWRFGARAVVAAALGICIIGSGLFLLTPVGLPVMALGLAPIFPTLMTLTPLRFGRAAASSVAGYQVGAATAGGGAFPAILGGVFTLLGVGLLPSLLLAAVVALALLVLATEAGLRARRPAATPGG